MSNIIRQIMALFDVEATEQRGHRTKKTPEIKQSGPRPCG